MQVAARFFGWHTSIMTVASMSFAARNEETYHCSVGYNPGYNPESVRGLGYVSFLV